MSRFDCQRAREALVAGDRGALSADDRDALNAHLSVCPDCAEEQVLWSTAATVARTIDVDPAPPLVQRRQLAGRPAAHRRPPALTTVGWLVVAAACLTLTGSVAAAVRWWGAWPGPSAGEPPGGIVVAPSTTADADRVFRDSGSGAASPPPGAAVTSATDETGGPSADSTASSGSDGVIRELSGAPMLEDRGANPVEPSAVLAALDVGDVDGAADLAGGLDISRHDQPTIDALTRLAQAQRASGRYAEACEVYGRLVEAYPDSAAASNARVAVGQIELTALQRPDRAATAFEDYLGREPLGPLSQDARLGIVRARVTTGTPGQVLAATDQYLAFHPDGNGAAEVLLARADALRATGRCGLAESLYHQVIGTDDGSAHRAAAEAGLEACSLQETP